VRRCATACLLLLLLTLTACQQESSSDDLFDSLARDLPPDRPQITFRDVAAESGISFTHARGTRSHMLPEDMGSGGAWGDYNNDGYPDLYLVNHPGSLPKGAALPPDAPGNKLFRNNGDGTFTDVTEQTGTGLQAFGMVALWGDYNNDGCLDLYVTNFGPSVLYHNDCGGGFTNVTSRAGVANNRWATGATWFDYDNDGYLDLYVCNYVAFDPEAIPRDRTSQMYGVNVPFTLNPISFDPQPNRLYHNNRDGTFTDVAEQAGVDDPEGRSLVVTFADFDLDGRPDLYVGNDISANSFFRNTGNGRFEDLSASSATEEYRGTMGIAVGDFDRDNDLDFFLTHWVAQANALYQSLYNDMGDGGRGSIFYADVADMEGVGSISMNDVSWGTAFLDFDNDGRLDLAAVNGSTLEDQENKKLLQQQPPRLLWNQGESGFYDVAPVSGEPFRQALNGRGFAAADYDNDGDLDFLVTTNRGPAMLLRNDGGNRKNWIKFRLRGVASNRQGLGVKVWLTTGGVTHYTEMGVGGSYLSQSFQELHFGLGTRHSIDKLELHWPAGTRHVFHNLAANQLVEIVESGPEAGLRLLTLPLPR
jgi:hypothetical protein